MSETTPEEIDQLIEMFGLAMRHGRGEQATYDALRTAILRALRSPADRIAELEARVGTLSVALEMARSPAPAESAAPEAELEPYTGCGGCETCAPVSPPPVAREAECGCGEGGSCEQHRIEYHSCGEAGDNCDGDAHFALRCECGSAAWVVMEELGEDVLHCARCGAEPAEPLSLARESAKEEP